MRIGLTLYGSLANRSGGFRYDRRLVEGLRAAGDTVDVVELPWRSYPRGLLDNLSPDVRDRLDIEVDVMLQDELAHPSLAMTNRGLPYPIVSIVHHLRSSESHHLSPLYRAVERRYLNSVHGAVCNSHATQTTVTDLATLTAAETVVAPPGGDHIPADVSPRHISERAKSGPLRVVFVGNLTPRKGLIELVDALATLDADWELTVVGRPDDESYVAAVRERIRTAHLEDNVTLVGECPDDALASILRENHVLAVPSRYEGFGLVYLEAMGFGLPVIAAAAGGASDVVTAGETGFLVEPDESERLVTALDRFATDRTLLAEMGRAARRRYEHQPSWSETADRVRSFLGRVVDGQPSEVVQS